MTTPVSHDTLKALSHRHLQQLRIHGPLQTDEQLFLDDLIVEVAESRLNAVIDLMGRGLTRVLPNPFGQTAARHHKRGDTSGAETGMVPKNRQEQDMPQMTAVTTPNPFTYASFQLDRRTLEASRQNGTDLETSLAEASAEDVGDQLENLLINGGPQFDSNDVFGYLTETNRNTFNFESNLAWDNASKTGVNIIADVLTAIQKAEADNYFGPYMLYVTDLYHNALQDDYKAESDRLIIERIRAIDNIIDVKPSGKLPANTIVLVDMRRAVVDLLVGDLSGQMVSDPRMPPVPITVIPWDENPMLHNFLVVADIVPRPKSTSSGQSGIVVGTPS